MTRALTRVPSRRDVLRGLASAGLGFAVLRRPGTASSKKKRKRKNKKPKLKRNAFGCVDVGGKCQGKSANCCSGICDGNKPKKGKKDSSVCVAHDNAGICFPDSGTCTIGENSPCSANCSCLLTTGNAGFCADNFTTKPAAGCRVCSKDTECQAVLGPGAACVFLTGFCSAQCAETGRTGCIPPCPAEAP